MFLIWIMLENINLGELVIIMETLLAPVTGAVTILLVKSIF